VTVATTWWPPALRFAPYGETLDTPNVVVDGSANPATVLTLSHWPKAPCPPDLRADLSAQSALAYLSHPGLHSSAEVVTNNHFDQDGLMSVFALVDPGGASDRSDLVVEVARAGDFALTSSVDAAHISMAIAAYADPDRSPVGAAVFAGTYEQSTAQLYAELLPQVRRWLDEPNTCRDLWVDEDAQLRADQALLASGRVAVEEVPELDLTVVTLPVGLSSTGGHRFGGMWSDLIHPLALHQAIDGLAVLLVQGDRVELRYRYESWVQYQSRRVRPRVDLTALADELTEREPGEGRWTFDGVAALTPALHVEGSAGTALAPADVRRLVEQAMRTQPPAFDPYVGAGSAPESGSGAAGAAASA
jgi:hypothetical protein